MTIVITKEDMEKRQWYFDRAKIERQPDRKGKAWLGDKLGYDTDHSPNDFCDTDKSN